MEGVVFDNFDVKDRVAIDWGRTGVVVIFDAKEEDDQPESGKSALIIRPDGWMIRARMGEVKRHGNVAFGVFFPKLTMQDAPIGSRIRWGSDFWPSDVKGEVSTIGSSA
jgi:hypothetical protein